MSFCFFRLRLYFRFYLFFESSLSFFFFFFNDTATTEIYTLSLHDALPISSTSPSAITRRWRRGSCAATGAAAAWPDRKSTRLNSSHSQISYAVFCLKKKKQTNKNTPTAQVPTKTRSDPRTSALDTSYR